MTFGTYPLVSLANANRMRGEAKEKLDRGEDPGAQIVEERMADRQAATVAYLAEYYLEKWARPRKRSAGEDERILRRDVLPAWGRRKAKDIKRQDTRALLEKIVERGAPIAANRTLAVIRKMFNFAVERDILEVSPIVGVKAPSPENRRDRDAKASS